jgi:CBS domain-containing protein
MKVSEAMTRGLEFVPADATVQEAATTMAEHDIGAVLVGSPDGLEGILTDRDIILRVVVDGRNPAEVPVGEVMSSTVFTCRSDDAVEAVAQTMQERQVRRLPVLDEEGQVVGIVARSDLAARNGGTASREPDRADRLDQAVASPH